MNEDKPDKPSAKEARRIGAESAPVERAATHAAGITSGAMVGAMAGAVSGMAIGPVAGGLIYDVFASYGWLYIGAWGLGIGAFLIALTFKPFPRERPALAAA